MQIETTFHVKNFWSETVTFAVETDLPSSQNGSQIQIHGDAFIEYNISFSPKSSGTFVKSVKFLNIKDGSYIWYTVNVSWWNVKLCLE